MNKKIKKMCIRDRVTGMTPLEWRKRPENYEQQLLKFDIHSEEGW